MKLTTSYSALSKHRQCPQAWGYSYVRALERVPEEGDTIGRDFGTWWHVIRAAESILTGLEKGTLRYKPKRLKGVDGYDIPTDDDRQLAHVEVMRVIMRWWKSLAPEVQELWTETIREHPVQRLLHMDREYRKRWASDREHEEPVGVEVQWRKQVPGSEVILVGTVDLVYRDRKRNLLVARDHKTSGDITRRNVEDDLLDSQLHLYQWGLVEHEELLGGRVNAVAYDRARSTAPREPKLTHSGNLSKAVTDYDLATYRKWAESGPEFPGTKKDGSGAGVYALDPKIVEDLSSATQLAKWFSRTLTPSNRHVVEAHLKAARDTAQAIPLTRERVAEGEPAPRNFGMPCRWCDFRDLCLAEMIGGRVEDDLEEQFKLRPRTDWGAVKKKETKA